MTTRATRTFTASTALVLTLLAGLAQASGTPDQLAIDYMAALRKDGLTAAPAFIDPAELLRFKEMLMPLVRREAASGDMPITEALFGKGTKLAQVEAMPPLDFCNALMRVLGEKIGDVKYGEVQVLGTVREKDVVHVVARVGTEVSPGVQMNTVTVISTRKSADGWKLMLTGELEGLAAGLRSQ